MSIPKRIHIAWNDKNVLQNKHPLITNGLLQLKNLNPTWEIEINDDNDINYYLKHALLKENYSLIEDIEIVPKTDIWRLLKIFYEGGLYIDIDRYCNKSIDGELLNNYWWILPVCDYKDFSHDIMFSAPYNPAFANIINLYFNRRREGNNNTYFLGAQTYMHGVTLSFFDYMIDSIPGEQKFKEMIQFMKTYDKVNIVVEKPPGDTIFYDGGITFDDWAEIKKSFYAENKIKHWTGEW